MRTAALSLALVVLGCNALDDAVKGSGTPKTQSRDVAPYSQLQLSGALHADVTAGAVQFVELAGDDNIVPLITTEVDAGRLIIKPRRPVAPKLELRARLAVQSLTALSTSGSTKVKVAGIFVDAFDLTTSGSSEVTASGTAKKLTIGIAGAGSIDAGELKAEDVTIRVSGSGEIVVAATGVLDVNISGSGRVRYVGTPRDIRKSISGSGTIEPR